MNAVTNPDLFRIFQESLLTSIVVVLLVWFLANPFIRCVIFYVMVRAAVRKYSKNGDRSQEFENNAAYRNGFWNIANDTRECWWATIEFVVFMRKTKLESIFTRIFIDDNAAREYTSHVPAGELIGGQPGTDVVARLATAYNDVVTFGPTMGIVERTLVFTMAFYQRLDAVALVLASKGLIVQLLGGNLVAQVAAANRAAAGTRGTTEGAFAGATTEAEVPATTAIPAQVVSSKYAPLDMSFFEKETYLLGSLLSFVLASLGGLYLSRLDVENQVRKTPPLQVSPSTNHRKTDVVPGIASVQSPEMEMSKTKVLFDVDTGVDDALALMLAFNSPELEIVGISTVSGNISAEQARLNTNFLARQFGQSGKWTIAAGEHESLGGRQPQPIPNIHGIDGLGGIRSASGDKDVRGETTLPGKSKGVQLILDQARALRGKLRIIATGPLTNIARALQSDRETMEQVDGLYIMGGALDVKGNISPSAEFNAFCDPAAYDLVLKSEIPVTLFPLDVTESVKILHADLNENRHLSPARLALLRDITRVYAGFHFQTRQFDGCYMHDVHPVAGMIRPSLFEFKHGRVVVETSRTAELGKLSWSSTAGVRSIAVAKKVDADAFLDLFWSRMRFSEPLCEYYQK